MNSKSSYDLNAHAQRGSPEDAGILYSRFHQSIYRYLLYRTGDARVAEDLTAEVFLKMVQALPSYHFESVPFQAWLFQVARNLAIDHYRRTNAHPATFINEDLDSEDPAIDREVENRLTTADLLKALERLEGTQRDVIALRFIEGLAIAEAAKILHKSEDSIKALQRRGLKMLRSLLANLEKDHEPS